MYITINHYNELTSHDIRQAWERPYEEENDAEDDGAAQAVFTKNIRFVGQNRARFDTPLPVSDARTSETPPADEEHLLTWYYRFDDYARCYVLAVTLLYGATVREIHRRTDELYRLTLIEKQNSLQPMTPQRDSS